MDEDAAVERRRGLGDVEVAPPPRLKPWNLPAAWNIPDVDPQDDGDPGRPLAALVSIHYLTGAVRRRWLRTAALGVLGLVLSLAYLFVNPPQPMATTTVMLTHDHSVQASDAIATDISLMTTRTVAERTIQALGLSMSPEALLATVTPVPSTSPELAQITMTAPTAAEAVRRLQAFSSAYLEFRNGKVAAQSTYLIDGYQDRLNDLTSDFKTVSAEIQTFKAKGDVGNDEYANALADRSRLSGQISELQQQIQAATLQRDAIVKASQVLDSATAITGGRVRHAVLVVASGAFAGVAAAVGLVVLQAILSDRLWLRIEVATALRSRVRLSVRRLRPLPRLLRGLPWIRRVDALRVRARHVTGDAIAAAFPGLQRRRSLGVLCLSNSGELAFGVLAAAAALRREGHEVALVDLTVKGALQSAGRRSGVPAEEEGAKVVRPPVVPSLRNGPGDLDRAAWEELAAARPAGLVTLILADVDTAVGLDHLAAWTDDVVVAVTAGRSSVELVRTTGDLVRSAGLTLHGALLLRALRDDVSSGKAVQEGMADVDALTVADGRSQRAERSLRS